MSHPYLIVLFEIELLSFVDYKAASDFEASQDVSRDYPNVHKLFTALSYERAAMLCTLVE